MLTLFFLSAVLIQDPPTVTATIRPEAVREGQNVVVTVRVESDGASPDEMTLEYGDAFDLVGTDDRFVNQAPRGSVWERDYVLTAWEVGTQELTVTVSLGDEAWSVGVAGPNVLSGGGWRPAERPRRTDRDGPIPEGTPPPVSEDAQRVTPGYPNPGGGFGGLRPGLRYGPGGNGVGRYPGGHYPGSPGPGRGYPGGYGEWMTGGWAETADSDPWWAELVPELFHYDAVAEDPSGFLRLETGLTPDQVYVGQQVTLFATVTLLPEAVSRMGRVPRFVPPEPASFSRDREVFGATGFPSATQGRTANSYSFQQAYFTQEAGEWSFPMGALRYGFSGRGDDEELLGGVSRVEVLPIPLREAPDGFKGAVGRYDVRAEVLTPRVRWGEVGLLRVEVRGVGDVRALQQPDVLGVWGAELTLVDEWAWTEVRQGVIGGVRVFDFAVVPMEALTVELGPVILTYFDPYVGAFRTVASGELGMEVLPPDR